MYVCVRTHACKLNDMHLLINVAVCFLICVLWTFSLLIVYLFIDSSGAAFLSPLPHQPLCCPDRHARCCNHYSHHDTLLKQVLMTGLDRPEAFKFIP